MCTSEQIEVVGAILFSSTVLKCTVVHVHCTCTGNGY